MIHPMKLSGSLAALCCLVSCAGYHLGGAKPASMAKVHSIAVTMFDNVTLHPRAEAIATSAVTSAMVQDGTYRLAGRDHADAVLEGKLSEIKYSVLRSTRTDVQHPEELSNTVTLLWKLRDARDPTKTLASGSSTGTSTFYVGANLQTARNNALPDALEQAGEALVSHLSNGY